MSIVRWFGLLQALLLVGIIQPAYANFYYTYCQPDVDDDSVGYGEVGTTSETNCSFYPDATLIGQCIVTHAGQDCPSTVPGENDNCPTAANVDQLDTDGDAEGDACDADDDNDGLADASDNCPVNASPDQTDTDHDFIGDVCDPFNDTDSDADGSPNNLDNCMLVHNPDQVDTDGDTTGDACDTDDDNDGVTDAKDAFPQDSSASVDSDGDGFPDVVVPLMEGFETGNFSGLPWVISTRNESTWSVSGASPYVGTYSAACRFPNWWPADGSCTLEVSVMTGSEISFRHFQTAVYLQEFYIDGVAKSVTRASGTWVLSSYTLTPGRHQLKWIFSQDNYAASGYSYLDEIFLGSSLTVDNCPLLASADQQDTDSDDQGNVCDLDDDNDSVPDYIDSDPLNTAVNTEVTLPVNGGYKGSVVNDRLGVQ